MRQPVVELSDCILCEVCSGVCPEVFSITEVGYIEVADLSEYPEEEVVEAINNCPSSCIYWSQE